MSVLGRSVRLYLVDGSPTGILTAEIMNWTGHVLVAPRSRLGDALQRDEASKTGVYFLFGDDPAQPTKPRVYIGEGDSVVERIKSHAKDPSKDFWTRTCIVTSKDANLTKAHVRYLENRFVQLTKQADRASVANGNEPSPKSLPESDTSDMEFFISQVQVVLPVIGFDFLRPRPHVAMREDSAVGINQPSSALDLMLSSRKHGYEARAIEVDGEFTVLAGSMATTKADFAVNTYAALRQQLIKDGRIVPAQEAGFLTFAEDISFPSASAAAAVITNRNTNGRTAWKVSDTGMSLRDWQDAQVGVASSDGLALASSSF